MFLSVSLLVLDIMPTNHPFHVANLIIHILGHIFDSWSSRGKERVTSTTSQEPKVPDKQFYSPLNDIELSTSFDHIYKNTKIAIQI